MPGSGEITTIPFLGPGVWTTPERAGGSAKLPAGENAFCSTLPAARCGERGALRDLASGERAPFGRISGIAIGLLPSLGDCQNRRSGLSMKARYSSASSAGSWLAFKS